MGRLQSSFGAFVVLAVVAGIAAAAAPPCAISNHYILDPLPCPQAGPVTQTPNWQATAPMQVARTLHEAVRLQTGKVLVVGGRNENGPLASSELFDPDQETWTLTAPMSRPRVQPVATLLADGRVLVTGGVGNDNGDDFGRTATAEIFDPATSTWQSTGNMAGVRDAHAAVRLQNGKVLVAGGYTAGITLASAELYDPLTGVWSPTGSLRHARYWHTMTLLADGRVLAAKGSDDGDLASTIASAELYDPATGTWTAIADSARGSVLHVATLLPDGRVLFTSGNGGGIGGDDIYPASEYFDPATNAWSAGPDLLEPRYSHSATLLASGFVLVTGGAAQAGHFPNLQFVTRSAAEWLDPVSGTWSGAADLATPRLQHTATLLGDGRVLVAGGYVIDGGVHRSAEILRYRIAVPPHTVIEYRNLRDFPGTPGGHYFYTDDAAEIAQLDLGTQGHFTRTGRSFASGGSRALCRFYGSRSPGPNSHFFTLIEDECAALRAAQQTPAPTSTPQWNFEGRVFAADPPRPDGGCAAGTTPVYRAYNNAFTVEGVRNGWDSGHRLASSPRDIGELATLFGWREEGVAFCAATQ